MNRIKKRPGMWIAVARDIADQKKFRRQAHSKFELIGLLVSLTGASAEQRQDGYVDEDDLDDIAIGTDAAAVYAMVDCLVAIDCLSVVEGGGWYINGFDTWQVTEDEDSAQRAREREKKARQRAQAKAHSDHEALGTVDLVPGDSVAVPGDTEASPEGRAGLSSHCPPYRQEEEKEEEHPASREAAASGTDAIIGTPFDGYALVERLLTEDYAKPKPLDATKGRILKAVKTLLDDGVDPDHIREGLRWWTWRHAVDGTTPVTIHAVVDDVRNGRQPSRPTGSRPSAPVAATSAVAFDETGNGDDLLYGGAA